VAFVWRALARHGVRAAELEDACQEVFLVVHARLGEFEGRSSLRTWVYGIALRVALAFRRKAARSRVQSEENPPEQTFEADQLVLVEQRQTLSLIEQAVAQLSESKREVFALYELEGMTMAEVAVTLALPENTALYRLYAARSEIRAFLERHEKSARSPSGPDAARRMGT
jgi:RNA polymerase sigma-70 factor (ECF subfamily)